MVVNTFTPLPPYVSVNACVNGSVCVCASHFCLSVRVCVCVSACMCALCVRVRVCFCACAVRVCNCTCPSACTCAFVSWVGTNVRVCTCACVFVRAHMCSCLSACVCACVCVRASASVRERVPCVFVRARVRVCVCVCARVCVCASFPPLCDIFQGIWLVPRPPFNHVGRSVRPLQVCWLAHEPAPKAIDAYIPHTHTHTHHTIPLDSWFISRDSTIQLVSLCVHRDVPTTPLGTMCVRRPSQGYTHNPIGPPLRLQGCTYNPTGLSVLSQAQSGIYPQSHWSPCSFTGIDLYSHEDTGISSLKTPSETPPELILISVS